MSKTMKRWLNGALAAAALVCMAQPVAAQDSSGAGSILLTTTTTAPTTTTGAVVGVVITVMSPKEGSAHLRDYLQENSTEVLADLAMGGGRTGEDLAQMFGVEPEQRARFARALRSRRASLSAHVKERVTMQDSARFVGEVFELMREDELLRGSLPERVEGPTG